MPEYLAMIQTGVSTYGLWFVVVFLLLENVPIVGFVAPGLTILVLSGFLHDLIGVSAQTLFLLAWCTVVLADTIWYAIGRYSNAKSRWLRSIANKTPAARQILVSQPTHSLVCYQFMAYFRMFLPFSFGMYQYPWQAWMSLCIIASGLYTAVFFGLGVAGARLLADLDMIDTVVRHLNQLLAIAATIYGAVLLRAYLKLRHKEKDLG